jgi:hypothetical protein
MKSCKEKVEKEKEFTIKGLVINLTKAEAAILLLELHNFVYPKLGEL